MRHLKAIFALAYFVLAMANFVFSDVLKVRVTASQANIRLKATIQSEILSRIPLGAVLDVIKKEGDWYFVKLPPDEKGIVVTGYIHQSTVEVLEEIEKVAKAEEYKIEQEPIVIKPEIELRTNQERRPLSEKEKYFIKTDPYYVTWKRKLDQAEEEKKGTKKWIWLGAGGMGVGYLVMPIAGALAASGGRGEEGNTMVTIGMGVGIMGTATMIYGLITHHGKSEKIGKILEEGMIKGYILGVNINPGEKRYAVTFAVAF